MFCSSASLTNPSCNFESDGLEGVESIHLISYHFRKVLLKNVINISFVCEERLAEVYLVGGTSIKGRSVARSGGVQ